MNIERFSESCGEGGGVYEDTDGDYVLAADYDALAAELSACRTAQAETINSRNAYQWEWERVSTELATERLRADAAVGDANEAERRVAELEELMASQAKAIREERETYAMSMKAQQPSGLVLPGRMTTIPEGKTISYAAGYEAALDAVANLNRNTVPLELLERIPHEWNCGTFGGLRRAIDELRAMLAGDKP